MRASSPPLSTAGICMRRTRSCPARMRSIWWRAGAVTGSELAFKANSEPVTAPARHQIERMRAGHDLVRRMQIPAVESGGELARIDNRRADLPYDDAGSDISKPRRV